LATYKKHRLPRRRRLRLPVQPRTLLARLLLFQARRLGVGKVGGLELLLQVVRHHQKLLTALSTQRPLGLGDRGDRDAPRPARRGRPAPRAVHPRPHHLLHLLLPRVAGIDARVFEADRLLIRPK
jgi:hypothetical protein